MSTNPADRSRGRWPFESYRANALLIAILVVCLPNAAAAWLFEWRTEPWFELVLLLQGLALLGATVLWLTLLRPVDRTTVALERCAGGQPPGPAPTATGRLSSAAGWVIDQHQEQRRLLEDTRAENHLTGLYNRRWTEERLSEDLSRARRGQAELTVALLRITGVRQGSGEPAPLERRLMLESLSKLVRGNTRVGDWSGHWDNDQLVLTLWDDHDQAAEILKRIEAALSAIHIETSRGKILIPSLRIAAAKYNRRDTPKGLLNKLSDALDHGEGEPAVRLIEAAATPEEAPRSAASG